MVMEWFGDTASSAYLIFSRDRLKSLLSTPFEKLLMSVVL